ncbi:glutathione S-transferase T3-like isoform X1 [Manihot esculenta]|uniref:Uncharacterized protein n=1 Tax=Manihot esculenta TaxID=3983 RepID=A0ACB7H5Z1_MANES|nr:glutathione S-transferase T3-like isoform X1 [Manihot esculenta]KAG8647596.1 hypothetical protein MANES_09G090928v8 [Manihot esculenta]
MSAASSCGSNSKFHYSEQRHAEELARSAGYSTNEDVLLCRIYLDILQDPIIGKQQSSQRFWSRVAEAYEVAKNEFWESRNARSLQCRMQVIVKAIRKLNGCYRQVENLHLSDASEQNLLNQAKTLFMQDPSYEKGFKFDHVWSMMKDAEKFKDIAGEYTSSDRPLGVKKAKLKKKFDESFSSALKCFHSDNEKLVESLANATAEREKERLMRSRALDLKEFKEENKILLLDLNSISDPIAHETFRQEKIRILEKRAQRQQPPPSSASNVYGQYLNDISGSRSNLSEY